jgi:hypothetical protein
MIAHGRSAFANDALFPQRMRRAPPAGAVPLIRLPQFVGDATLIRQPERKGEP